ncbi:MAG: DUF86 domain-containing protein [Bacteroidales bacterium]|nr:DUF86 domain-containing protein [Bacteroidales bacterium]
MRESIRDKERLVHILRSICDVEEFTQGFEKDTLPKDKLHYYAVVKAIEIIGEAAYMLTNDFKEAHPETPWKMIAGMRHYIVHEYYQVDSRVVWEVITCDLPQLKEQISDYIEELEA